MAASSKNTIMAEDWSQVWDATLPTKITSLVLWGIAVVGLTITVILLWGGEKKLKEQFESDASIIAFELTQQISKETVTTKQIHAQMQILMKRYEFTAVELPYFALSAKSENKSKDDEHIQRTIFIKNDLGQIIDGTVNLHHTPISNIFKFQQKQYLLSMTMICLIFGLFLTWSLHKIVSKPFQAIIDAIHKALDGDLSGRIITSRNDEFGEAALFFNQMLDRVVAQQEAMRSSNLTKLKKARDEAIAANRSKSEFLANMSHEIRTPLNAILGYTQLIQRKSNLEISIKEATDIIEKSSDHLLKLINDILDLSKIEAGRMSLNLNDFDLAVLINDLSDMFMIRCEEKGIHWQVVLTPEKKHIPVKGDEGKLKQVLINLLGNALKFTNEGNITFKITLQETQKYLFEVIDSGEGISREAQKNIFSSFHQEHVGIKTGGTGLGLAISSKQIKFMGGELQVESEHGKGSRFFFNINFEDAVGDVIQATSRYQNVKHLAPGFNITALVADDNEINRKVLQSLLETIGVNVHLAIDGQDAIEKAQQVKPDIIFMDWRMPKLDGLEAMKKIHNQYGNDIKNVMISASALDHEYETLVSSGASYVLKKPFKEEEIFYCLHQVLGTEFEFDEKQLVCEIDTSHYDELSLSNITLPENLIQKINQAATLYDISALESLLDQLRQSPDNLDSLYSVLTKKLNQYDMEGIIEMMSQLQENLYD